MLFASRCMGSSSSSPEKLAILRWGGSVNWFRISRLRRPRNGVSTVRNTALKPAFFARWMSLLLCAFSSNRYSCSTFGMCPLASATSSSDLVANDDKPIATSYFLQAPAVPTSPSECARHCIAVGATPIGMLFRWPKMLTVESTLETSRSTRGRMRYFSYADVFSRSVEPESAPSL